MLGALFWSGLTLLTAVHAHLRQSCSVRHTLVGIGEATFVTIAPAFVADLFSEDRRGSHLGRVLISHFRLAWLRAICSEDYLGPSYGWRFPFYIAAIPGFVLGVAVLFLKEPERGQFDSSKATPERGTILGLAQPGISYRDARAWPP